MKLFRFGYLDFLDVICCNDIGIIAHLSITENKTENHFEIKMNHL